MSYTEAVVAIYLVALGGVLGWMYCEIAAAFLRAALKLGHPGGAKLSFQALLWPLTGALILWKLLLLNIRGKR